MADKFQIISLRQLIRFIFSDTEKASLLGIPEELFFKPDNKKFYTYRYNKLLHLPLGVAAGPHTQLAQNIIASWLCGARYIELKTIQTLDELEVTKPCIDAADEAYNCEWSQELKIHESYDQYLNAWIIIHLLAYKMGFSETGCIFNMSAGYNLEGILKENVQWFFSKMQNCSLEKNEKIKSLEDLIPWAKEVKIPDYISDNITLSTMHGCPPEEIESIGLYLIKEKKLHTTIKLNPTLLGKEEVRKILNNDLGFETIVPDEAFAHDLKYNDAINLINRLQSASIEAKVEFGIKLSNTLESVNIREVLPAKENMNYMSGRALHPISIKLAAKLQQDFEGKLDISFSAGADCFNFPEIIACNLKPVTVCTDLLKPGGYMRLAQYAEELNKAFEILHATDIDDFIIKKNDNESEKVSKAAINNLVLYSEKVIHNAAYKKEIIAKQNIKTNKNLNYFDCISAPCVETCPTNQNIPQYMYHTAKSEPDKAYTEIIKTNALPNITGVICDHPCQLKCTRMNYDESLQIREIKRYVTENAQYSESKKVEKHHIKAAVIGAGPSGLSCAYYLALAGFDVNVYDEKSEVGGMVRSVIPAFRLDNTCIDLDFNSIKEAGVNFHFNTRIDKILFKELSREHEYIYISTGAQLAKKLDFEPDKQISGLFDPLSFLAKAKLGEETGIGKNVAIIGGGNTAMDAARTAWRLVGENGKVSIVYRRTISEMPADLGEIKAVIEEGIQIFELIAPENILVENDIVKGLSCVKMQLTAKDEKGRKQIQKIENSAFEMYFDTIIPAIGQDLDIDFIDNSYLKSVGGEYKTKIPGVYIGGDALRGASTAINAIADGRKTAEQIIKKVNLKAESAVSELKSLSYKDLMIKKPKRIKAEHPFELAVSERRNFNKLSQTFNKEQAEKEAERCLYCDEICNICVTVCPNFANYAYQVEKQQISLPKAILSENGIILENDKEFEIKQSTQIVNIADFCNECGNCNTFCPTSGAPYKDKPHFYLNIKSFKDAAYGYYFNEMKDRTVLIYKDKQFVKTLTLENNRFIYETDQISAEINTEKFEVSKVVFKASCVKEAYFDFAAEMYVMFKGLLPLAAISKQ